MPQMTFSTSMLNSAMPGLSKLAASLGGGDMAYQAGQEHTQEFQSKLAQAMAQIEAHKATAAYANAHAASESTKNGILTGRPQLYREQVSTASGVSSPIVDAIRESQRTGQIPSREVAGPTEGGGPLMAEIDPESVSKVRQAMQQFLPLLSNAGDLQPDQLAHAAGRFREMGLSDKIIGGTADRNTVAGAQAAASGAHPLFHTGENGSVLDLFGGGLNTANPMAKSSISLRGAQAGQASAAAADHYAGAGLKSAQRNEVVNGPKGQLVQSDAGPVFADPRTGRSVPVVSQDGRTLGAKLKDIPPPVNARIMEGKQGLTNIDDAIAAIQASPDALGWVNAIPGAQSVRQMTDPNGIPARAKVANIGSLVLHDRSGAAVSASEFPRLAPFIPSPSDRPQAAIMKLMQMKKIAEDELGLYTGTYGPDNGYRESPIMRRAATGSGERPPLESFNR